MIHPHTCLQHVDDVKGYGVFATRFIPKGTIVYVIDELEIKVPPDQFRHFPQVFQQAVEKFSFIDQDGVRIVSWDFAKYVNHCCNCNTMSTGYGFEIAIRDIYPGEEITDEYAIFNLEQDMHVTCSQADCRGCIRASDFDRLYPVWDETLKTVLALLPTVQQPLYDLLDPETRAEVEAFLKDPSLYKSVYTLKQGQSGLPSAAN